MGNLKIGIALSGGGALGMAHIGVLKALEENNIKPNIVVGTSIGSLVGGVYASGLPLEKIEEEALKVKTSKLYDVNLNMSGFLSGRSAIRTIKNILGLEHLIEELPIKYGAVAVDITNGEELLITQGSLIEAIRASISCPGVFVPFKKDNKLLVDGGVLNNLPEDHVKNFGADVVLSVNLLHNYIPYTKPKTAIHSVAFGWFIMQKKLIELKPNYADLRINLDLNKYRQYIFSKKTAEELISIGYNETIKLMPQIKAIIENAEKKITKN